MSASIYQRPHNSASELQITLVWDSILEDKHCSLIPLLHPSLQVHSLLVYGKYSISQSPNNGLSPLNGILFDSLCKVLKRRPSCMTGNTKQSPHSQIQSFSKFLATFIICPRLFLIGRNIVPSFPVVYKRGTKNYRVFPFPHKQHTLYPFCALKCFLSKNLTTVSNNPSLSSTGPTSQFTAQPKTISPSPVICGDYWTISERKKTNKAFLCCF